MPGQYPARVSDHGFWAVQSLVTEPGPAAAAIDQLPSDLGALRAASRQLVSTTGPTAITRRMASRRSGSACGRPRVRRADGRAPAQDPQQRGEIRHRII